MLPSSGSALSQLVDSYHLWDCLILFVVLGVYHFLTITILHGFRFLGEVNEAYYNYRARCAENRRRYKQVVAESGHILSRGAGTS
jgi:hypothetical protein